MEFELPISLLGWLFLALGIIITVGFGFAFKYIASYFSERVNGTVFDQLRKWAYTYVAALKQDPYLDGLANEEKKQQAMLWLVMKAKQLGFELSEGEASALIEAAVFLLKKISLEQLEEGLEEIEG